MAAVPTYWLIGLEALAVLGLAVLFVQDWRSRTVDFLLFPYLGVVFLSHRFLTDSWVTVIGATAINLFLIGGFIVAIAIYLKVRFKASISELFTYLGPGDLLFWMVVSMYLPDVEFVIYFIGSLVFALLIFGMVRLLQNSRVRLVPLAGLQAGYLLVWIIGSRLFPLEKAVLLDWFLAR